MGKLKILSQKCFFDDTLRVIRERVGGRPSPTFLHYQKVTCTTYINGFGEKQVVFSIDGSRFGSETLSFTKWYRGFAVAKSDALFDMAKRESQIAKAEREKEDQLRKKLEVDNAADAF